MHFILHVVILLNLIALSWSSWGHFGSRKHENYFAAYVTSFNKSIIIPIVPSHGFTLKTGNRFGKAIAVYEDVAIVSATNLMILSNDNRIIADSGAFIFERQIDGTWHQYRDVLLSGTDILADGFGESVAITKRVAVVGAWKDNTLGTFSGRAYIFFNNDTNSDVRYSDRQALYPSNPSAGDFFGYSVAIIEGFKYFTDGVVLIGAYGYDIDNRNINTGAVYVFARPSGKWIETEILQPSQPCAYCCFGWSIDTSNTNFIVGAPTTTGAQLGSGSAYVYRLTAESSVVTCGSGAEGVDCVQQTSLVRSDYGHEYRVTTSWNTLELALLTSSVVGEQDLFGADVAIFTDTNEVLSNGAYKVTVAVAAIQDAQYASNAGKVYIFQSSAGYGQYSSSSGSNQRGQWTLIQKILGNTGARLGSCVSLQRGRLLIGADYGGRAAGEAVVYEADGLKPGAVWYQVASLPRPAFVGDYFGSSCALGDIYAVVGAYQIAGPGSSAGGKFGHTSAPLFSASGTGVAASYSCEAGVWIGSTQKAAVTIGTYSLNDVLVMVSSVAFVSILFAVIMAVVVFRSLYFHYIAKRSHHFRNHMNDTPADHYNKKSGRGGAEYGQNDDDSNGMDASARSTDPLFAHDRTGYPHTRGFDDESVSGQDPGRHGRSWGLQTLISKGASTLSAPLQAMDRGRRDRSGRGKDASSTSTSMSTSTASGSKSSSKSKVSQLLQRSSGFSSSLFGGHSSSAATAQSSRASPVTPYLFTPEDSRYASAYSAATVSLEDTRVAKYLSPAAETTYDARVSHGVGTGSGSGADTDDAHRSFSDAARFAGEREPMSSEDSRDPRHGIARGTAAATAPDQRTNTRAKRPTAAAVAGTAADVAESPPRERERDRASGSSVDSSPRGSPPSLTPTAWGNSSTGGGGGWRGGTGDRESFSNTLDTKPSAPAAATLTGSPSYLGTYNIATASPSRSQVQHAGKPRSLRDATKYSYASSSTTAPLGTADTASSRVGVGGSAGSAGSDSSVAALYLLASFENDNNSTSNNSNNSTNNNLNSSADLRRPRTNSNG